MVREVRKKQRGFAAREPYLASMTLLNQGRAVYVLATTNQSDDIRKFLRLQPEESGSIQRKNRDAGTVGRLVEHKTSVKCKLYAA